MRWFYEMRDKSIRLIIYAYSRESDALDGLIVYDVQTKAASIMKPASMDSSSKKAQAKALEHFENVVSKGFPDKYYSCCG